MNKRLTQLLLSVFFLGVFNNCLAQGEVNVNNFKGTASVRVPLIEFNMNEVKHDVALQYIAQSVKVKQGGGEISTGWTFDGEGKIERVLKGLPDEKNATGGDNRVGWMAQSNHAKPLNFSISDDNNESTCTDEGVNFNSIHNNFGYLNDPEPDWFVVDAPGLKCRLILDNSNNFKVIPVQDIKVEITYPNGIDPAFIITNATGVKYTFVTNSKITRSVTQINSVLDLFVNDYEYFKTPLTYIKTWHLDKVSRVGNEDRGIIFSYTQKDPVVTSDYTTVNSITQNIPAINKIDVNRWTTSLTDQKLNGISTSLGQSLSIIRDPQTDVVLSFNINEGNLRQRNITLNRLYLNNDRSFLESITETAGGCSSKPYKFEYYGCNFTSGTSILPPLATNKKDAWGNFYDEVYDSPKIYVYPTIGGNAGIYRPYLIPNYQGEHYLVWGNNTNLIDESSIKAGLMSKITYPLGGSSAFEYESNSFWDEDANAEIKGAGVRIKSLRHFDGISPAKSTLINYFYNIPGQTRTSGSIKSLPQIAITTNSSYQSPTRLSESQILGLCSAQSAEYWQYHTLFTENLSSNSQDVQYEYVTVRKNAIGRTEYKYSIESTLWSQDSNSMVYLASACSSAKYPGLPVKKGYNQYPFLPKEEKEYASGLLLQEKVYTENNVPVKFSDYEYEDYYTSPPIIYGVAFDRVDGNEMFSRYGVHVNGKLLKKEKETTYDTGISGNTRLVEATYDNSAQGRQIKTKTVLNSDNSVTQSSYTYTGDFPFQAVDVTSDPYAEGIYLLNQKNIKNVVVEQLIKRKESGAPDFKVYEGQLTLFKKGPANSNPALNHTPLLTEVKSFSARDGIINFGEVSFNNGFLTYHPNYKSKQKLEDYDEYNLPTLITTNRIKKAVVYHYSTFVPVAEFYGSELKNIVFSGYDGGVLRSFQIENMSLPDFTNEAHTGTVAAILRSSGSFYRDFVKAPGTKFYTISLWVKSTNAATISILLNNSTVGNINCNASDKFVFYQKQIDVSMLPDNSVIKLTSSQNVILDDVVFCPLGTSYLISTYDYPYGKASETNSSGKTLFWEYDLRGRPLYTRDGDRNIIQSNTYQSYNTTSASLSAQFNRVENTFSTANSCLIGVKYKWDFGDGTVLETYNPSVTHVLAPGGPHTVTLTVTHPDLGTKTYSESINMPLLITVCAAGVIVKDVCGFDPEQYGDCSSGYTPPPSGATLYVTNVDGAGGQNLIYEWQKFVNGDWVQVTGSVSSSYEQPLWLGTYGYRCKVSTSNGLMGYSNAIFLNYYQSQPNCPLPNEN